MLQRASDLRGYTIRAKDGDIGKVNDFYFDDARWTVRYIVVDTGGWLTGRRVVLSPSSVDLAMRDSRTLRMALTKEQIEKSPPIETATEKPISRREEAQMSQYYGWPAYWGPGAFVRPSIYEAPPGAEEPNRTEYPEPNAIEEEGPNLRSMREVAGYHIQALDDEIGHVDDFVLDDELWAVRYLVVDTRNILPGKKVLLSPEWIQRIRWSDSRVLVDLEKEAIRESPEFKGPVTRDDERRLYEHYGKPPYWRGGAAF